MTVEIDPVGDGDWLSYWSFEVPAGVPLEREFPAGFSAQWVRFTADTNCRATATLEYR